MHRRGRGESGQAALEYVVVGAVVSLAIAGLGALWRAASAGALPRLVFGSVSHALGQVGGVVDVFLY